MYLFRRSSCEGPQVEAVLEDGQVQSQHPETYAAVRNAPLRVDARFIIDAGAANVDIMVDKPELQYYYSDLLRNLAVDPGENCQMP